jgi:PDZ domain-containing protein
MKRSFVLPLILVSVAAFALSSLPSGYWVLTPGGSYEVGPRLEIPEEYREEMGRLAFTAVYAGPASWVDVVEAALDPAAELVPAEEIRPPGVSQREMNEANRRLIDESKSVAAVVALQAAGYDAEVTGQGALVAGVVPGLPAEGVLQPGDIIVAVDGQPAHTAVEVVELTRRRAVGEQVRLAIVRDGQPLEMTLGTAGSPNEPGRPVVGAAISTYQFDVRLPFPVEIETESVGGPSAGLMFSLGILDAVTDGDLTRGNFVAGTGTISADGSVGPIGGAAEKVVAAERDGATLFLVPTENEAEARRTARSIQVVPVARFDEAVHHLCGLAPAGDAPEAPPTPCTTGGGAG